MRKFTILLALALGVYTSASSQVVSKGTMLIDGYYGIPNVATGIFRSAAISGNTAGGNLSVSSLGPLGGRFEYLLTDKFGLGINANYASSLIKWADTYNYSLSYNRFRVMATWNVHLSNSDKVDLYLGGGIGAANHKLEYKSNDPMVDADEYANTIKFNLPIAWRIIEFGSRFFITDQFGINASVGFGAGPLVAAGLSVKI